MAAACWQFFKESVRRLTGMNDPPPPLFSVLRGPFFPSSSLLLRSTIRKNGALRGSHMRPHRILLWWFLCSKLGGHSYGRWFSFEGAKKFDRSLDGDARTKLDGWIVRLYEISWTNEGRILRNRMSRTECATIDSHESSMWEKSVKGIVSLVIYDHIISLQWFQN